LEKESEDRKDSFLTIDGIPKLAKEPTTMGPNPGVAHTKQQRPTMVNSGTHRALI
jgi:hypothetical protein